MESSTLQLLTTVVIVEERRSDGDGDGTFDGCDDRDA